jgi:xylulokinase
MCIAHQRETFVPVDENAVPLRNAILWMDERAGGQLDYLEKVFGRGQFHELTGKPLSGNLSIAKIAWLRQNDPDVFGKTRKFLDVHAFLIYCLTGEYSTSWGSADPMGLFDMTQNRWALDLLQCIDLSPAQFPEAFPPGQVIGQVSQSASMESGLPRGLPIVAGIGDGQAAGLGSMVINSETAYLSLGTSVVSGYYAPDYQVSKKFRTMYGGVESSYFFETVILGGAYTISWFIEKVLGNQIQEQDSNQAAIEFLEKESLTVPAGAQGLLLIPYWNSAMNPYWDTKASGVIVGLRGHHGIGHIYRAILEGIAFEQRLHTTGVEHELGKKMKKFVVAGGGANSDFWCQIIADVTGKPVQRVLDREATALGAGILAASAAGIYSGTQEAACAMVHFDDSIFHPDETRNQIYTRLYEEVYRHIYPALRQRLPFLADC